MKRGLTRGGSRPTGWRQPGCRLRCLSVAAVPAFAHHSFGAEYDGTKPVTLTGVITMVQWTNPHFYFFMDVKDTNGAVGELEIRRLSSDRAEPDWLEEERDDGARRYGHRHSGWRARDGSNWAHSRHVTFAKNGKKLEAGPPAGNGDGGNTPPVVVP